MISDFIVAPWLAWTAGGLAGLIVVGAIALWLRRRPTAIVPEVTLKIQAVGGPRSQGATGSTIRERPFMPPPAPIAAPPTDPQAEQRATFRRVGNSVLIQVADEDSHHRPVNAWVIDRSRQGLRLAVEKELPIGGLFTVRAMNAPPATPWCPVEIRHCSAGDGHWEIGCRFLLPPPVQVLMLFG